MHVCNKVAPDISAPMQSGNTRARILVVEGSLINQAMVMTILKKNGYSIDAVPKNDLAALATLAKSAMIWRLWTARCRRWTGLTQH